MDVSPEESASPQCTNSTGVEGNSKVLSRDLSTVSNDSTMAPSELTSRSSSKSTARSSSKSQSTKPLLPAYLTSVIGSELDGSWSANSCLGVPTDPASETIADNSEHAFTSPLHAHTVIKFAEPEETLILVDWDDTLCPTSSCGELVAFGNTVRNAHGRFVTNTNTSWPSSALATHEAAVIAFLQEAAMLGGVAIVTMAEPKWVELCITRLMPEVGNTLKRLGIEVVAARIPPPASRRGGSCSLKQFDTVGKDECRELKKKAMLRIAKQFYGSRGFFRRAMGVMRPWKNIISIGDSDAERLALQDMMLQYKRCDKSGRRAGCHCKTLRLMHAPHLEELTTELIELRDCLSDFILHDGEIDLDMTTTGLASISSHNSFPLS